MTILAILMSIALLFIILSMWFDWFGISFTLFIATIFLTVTKILEPIDILNGISNTSVAVLIILVLISSIMRQKANVEHVFSRIFKQTDSLPRFLTKLYFVVGATSSILNNIPLVAIIAPYINQWGRNNRISVSKLFIPLSYTAILGGSLTLIGTSTNQFANSIIEDQKAIYPSLEIFGIFDFFPIAFVLFIVGFLFLRYVGIHLLPSLNTSSNKEETGRTYRVKLGVKKTTRYIGKKTIKIPLFQDERFQIEFIVRNGQEVRVDDESILMINDEIVIKGTPKHLNTLIETEYKSFYFLEGKSTRKGENGQLIEAVVSHNSKLISRKVESISFQAEFHAKLLGIYNQTQTPYEPCKSRMLKGGDVLLFYATEDFSKHCRESEALYPVTAIQQTQKIGVWRTALLLGGLIVSILLSVLNILPLLTGLLVLLILIVLSKIAHPKEMPQAIDYDLLMTIILSLSIGKAMINSSLAELIGNGVINLSHTTGTFGMMFILYGICTFFSAYINSKTAITIMLPIALFIANQMGLPFEAFGLLIAYATAANFMTPIGYPTNMMVKSLGKYHARDYFRIGAPLTILCMVTSVPLLYYLYIP